MIIPRIFEGQPVIIVAGGPSLIGFDFSRLAGKNVIAINRACEFVPGAQVLWWSDAKFWFQRSVTILAHPAPWKATCTLNYGSVELPEQVKRYRFTGHKGFDPDPCCLRSGNNSTYAAMHLGVHLGASAEILLGVDMKHGPNGETHFHGGHGTLHLADTMVQLMLPWFDTLAGPLAERGIDVFNCCPDSALHTWQRCTIEQGLQEYERRRKADHEGRPVRLSGNGLDERLGHGLFDGG